MKHQNKVILGGLAGNMLEAYDIALLYFLGTELAKALLGDQHGNPTIILGLIFFSYLARPLGSFLLGLFSDLYGRKQVLIISLVIMGLATTLIGIIPTYAAIGNYAVCLLLLLKIIQNMALGSEFLNSASFLVESGTAQKKGFLGCWPSVGVKSGFLLAYLMVEIIRYSNQLYPQIDWFWRLPFLLALVSTVAGYLIRANMPESLAYILYYAEHPKPTTVTIYRQAVQLIKSCPFIFNHAFFSILLSVSMGCFFNLYLPLHAAHYSTLSPAIITVATIISLALTTAFIPLFGWLSDRYDRLHMVGIAALFIVLLSYPCVQSVNSSNPYYYFFMQLAMAIPCACYYSTASVLLTELFPISIRCTALSIIFSIAASIGCGVPPVLANYLTNHTPYPNSPSLIIIVVAAVVLLNIFVLAKNYRLANGQYKIPAFDQQELSLPLYYQHTIFPQPTCRAPQPTCRDLFTASSKGLN